MICHYLQVNLFQKPLFLHQVTHNMTRDCLLNSPQKYKFRTYCVQNLFFCFWFDIQNIICTQHVLKLYFSGDSMNNLSSYLQYLVIWCKNKGFWKRFTCTVLTKWCCCCLSTNSVTFTITKVKINFTKLWNVDVIVNWKFTIKTIHNGARLLLKPQL